MEAENRLNVDVSKFLNKGELGLKKNRGEVDQSCADRALLKMLEEGLHTDITLVAQGGSVQAHRSVLASVSPVFCAMFRHNMKEQLTSTVDIPDMTIDALQLFLLVLYTTNEDVEGNTMADLVSEAIDECFAEFWGAVHKYQVVTRLEIVLLRALERNLTPDNCWDYLNGSLQGSRASSACNEYVLKNYENVFQSESCLKEMRSNPERLHCIMKKAMKSPGNGKKLEKLEIVRLKQRLEMLEGRKRSKN